MFNFVESISISNHVPPARAIIEPPSASLVEHCHARERCNMSTEYAAKMESASLPHDAVIHHLPIG